MRHAIIISVFSLACLGWEWSTAYRSQRRRTRLFFKLHSPFEILSHARTFPQKEQGSGGHTRMDVEMILEVGDIGCRKITPFECTMPRGCYIIIKTEAPSMCTAHTNGRTLGMYNASSVLHNIVKREARKNTTCVHDHSHELWIRKCGPISRLMIFHIESEQTAKSHGRKNWLFGLQENCQGMLQTHRLQCTLFMTHSSSLSYDITAVCTAAEDANAWKRAVFARRAKQKRSVNQISTPRTVVWHPTNNTSQYNPTQHKNWSPALSRGLH